MYVALAAVSPQTVTKFLFSLVGLGIRTDEMVTGHGVSTEKNLNSCD